MARKDRVPLVEEESRLELGKAEGQYPLLEHRTHTIKLEKRAISKGKSCAREKGTSSRLWGSKGEQQNRSGDFS